MTMPGEALIAARAHLLTAVRSDPTAQAVIRTALAPEERRTLIALTEGTPTACQIGRIALALRGERLAARTAHARDRLYADAWTVMLPTEQRWRRWARGVSGRFDSPDPQEMEATVVEAAVGAALRWDPARSPYPAYAWLWVRRALYAVARFENWQRAHLLDLDQLSGQATSEADPEVRAGLRARLRAWTTATAAEHLLVRRVVRDEDRRRRKPTGNAAAA